MLLQPDIVGFESKWGRAFSVGKEQPALDLGFKNPVFSDERFIVQQQFLIDVPVI